MNVKFIIQHSKPNPNKSAGGGVLDVLRSMCND